MRKKNCESFGLNGHDSILGYISRLQMQLVEREAAKEQITKLLLKTSYLVEDFFHHVESNPCPRTKLQKITKKKLNLKFIFQSVTVQFSETTDSTNIFHGIFEISKWCSIRQTKAVLKPTLLGRKR
mmetsp:Transcript_23837/g.48676  ORF Transcript_23837/g.48676 Transcript_23837/m.48676 type:complete len:126 (+) Transcript_23837:934-1311(+)